MSGLADHWRREGWWRDVLVGEHMAEASGKHGDTYTVFCSGDAQERVSNLERFADARATENALRAHGLKTGDVVAVQLTASRITASIYHACLNMGLVVLPIVTIYGQDEVYFILEQSGARLFFCHDVLRSTDYRERVPGYRKIKTLAGVVMVGGEACVGAMSWATFMDTSRRVSDVAPAVVERPGADDVCLIVYTSGTTSRPKGVLHTHNTLMAEWRRESFAIRGPHLCCFPMGHYTGFSFLMRPLVTGTSSVFMDRWDPDVAASLIEQYRITDCGGTPYFLITLLDAARKRNVDISSLESFPMGGTGITEEHIRMADRAGFVAGRVYGSTEHPTVTYTWSAMHFSQRGSTDGKIESGNEVKILDHHMNDLPLGCEGEVVTRGPELFVGYMDGALNRDAFVGDGWFRTGDLGRLDGNGCLTITGRIKDIIIRGGENISALEVEGYINEVAGVDEVAVVGMSDALLGEQVIAYVHTDEGASIDASTIMESLKRRGIAKQKIPVEVFFVKEFPRTPSGKIKKHELRDHGEQYTR